MKKGYIESSVCAVIMKVQVSAVPVLHHLVLGCYGHWTSWKRSGRPHAMTSWVHCGPSGSVRGATGWGWRRTWAILKQSKRYVVLLPTGDNSLRLGGEDIDITNGCLTWWLYDKYYILPFFVGFTCMAAFCTSRYPRDLRGQLSVGWMDLSFKREVRSSGNWLISAL